MNAAANIRALHDFEPSSDEFRTAVVRGLSGQRKSLPCKFFYDAAGSRIFDKICKLEQYYPTRTECAILDERAETIAKYLGLGARVVEFGSGAGIKIRLLLAALSGPASYVPIDISRQHLMNAATDLSRGFPGLKIEPVCADYTKLLALPSSENIAPRTTAGFFPGSTIGNFDPSEARDFLVMARRLLGSGAMMIVGVDIPKSVELLHAAYNDAAGVTAEFNLNLLVRINRELNGSFDLRNFRHAAHWNAELARVEMHIVSLRRQKVHIGEIVFNFEPNETIHTENSYKYGLDMFRALAAEAGYDSLEAWTDKRALFSVHLLRAH